MKHKKYCTIYKLFDKNNPAFGVCTCGYGLKHYQETGSTEHLYSEDMQIQLNYEKEIEEEKVELIEKISPELCDMGYQHFNDLNEKYNHQFDSIKNSTEVLFEDIVIKYLWTLSPKSLKELNYDEVFYKTRLMHSEVLRDLTSNAPSIYVLLEDLCSFIKDKIPIYIIGNGQEIIENTLDKFFQECKNLGHPAPVGTNEICKALILAYFCSIADENEIKEEEIEAILGKILEQTMNLKTDTIGIMIDIAEIYYRITGEENVSTND